MKLEEIRTGEEYRLDNIFWHAYVTRKGIRHPDRPNSRSDWVLVHPIDQEGKKQKTVLVHARQFRCHWSEWQKHQRKIQDRKDLAYKLEQKLRDELDSPSLYISPTCSYIYLATTALTKLVGKTLPDPLDARSVGALLRPDFPGITVMSQGEIVIVYLDHFFKAYPILTDNEREILFYKGLL